MTLQPRPYRNADDLASMKALVVEGRKTSPHSGYPHRGDLDWWLYYGAFVHGAASEDIITLWDDGDGLAGWVYLDKDDASEIVLHPRLRGTDGEREIVARTQASITRRLKGENPALASYAWGDDVARRAILEGDGYSGHDMLIYFTQALDGDIPTPALPEGFSFLERMRPEWADRRADVHFNAFRPSRMTAEAYAHFMTAPDYDSALDVVVVAPDGTFAAFAMCWIDPETGIGNFEPVGTRETMQRNGLGRAALLEGMRRMRAHGMTVATVLASAGSAGNITFYEAAGFQRRNSIRKYMKPVQPYRSTPDRWTEVYQKQP